MPEERLNIGRRVFTQEISKEKAASEYNISITTVVSYVKEYIIKGYALNERKLKVLNKVNLVQDLKIRRFELIYIY